MTQDLERFEGTAPRDLLAEFDKAWSGKFANRSEALRSLMRAFVQKRKRGVDVGS